MYRIFTKRLIARKRKSHSTSTKGVPLNLASNRIYERVTRTADGLKLGLEDVLQALISSVKPTLIKGATKSTSKCSGGRRIEFKSQLCKSTSGKGGSFKFEV